MRKTVFALTSNIFSDDPPRKWRHPIELAILHPAQPSGRPAQTLERIAPRNTRIWRQLSLRSTPNSWNSRSTCQYQRNLRSIQFNRWWKFWSIDIRVRTSKTFIGKTTLLFTSLRWTKRCVDQIRDDEEISQCSYSDSKREWFSSEWTSLVDARCFFRCRMNQFNFRVGSESERWAIHLSIVYIKSIITSRKKEYDGDTWNILNLWWTWRLSLIHIWRCRRRG